MGIRYDIKSNIIWPLITLIVRFTNHTHISYILFCIPRHQSNTMSKNYDETTTVLFISYQLLLRASLQHIIRKTVAYNRISVTWWNRNRKKSDYWSKSHQFYLMQRNWFYHLFVTKERPTTTSHKSKWWRNIRIITFRYKSGRVISEKSTLTQSRHRNIISSRTTAPIYRKEPSQTKKKEKEE